MSLAGAAVVVAVVGGLVARWISGDPPARAAVEFTVEQPDQRRFSATGGMMAVSPDGSHLMFVVIDEQGVTSLRLRPLASSLARPLDGTEGATNPFWSPDSRTVAFFSERRLKAVDVVSGAVRVVASLTSPRSMGGSWSRTDEILFSVPAEGMYLVDAAGGVPQRLAPSLDARCEDCAIWPQFLPDSRHFLYTVVGSNGSEPGIYVGEIGKSGGERLLDAVSSSSYVAPGFVAYARSGTLYVQRFDAGRLRMSGLPIPVADGVAYNSRTGRVLASISQTGVLAVRPTLITELVWVDRAGRELGIAAPAAAYLDYSIAPDGQRLAVARLDAGTGTSDIWVFDSMRGVRVTDHAGSERDPVWSEDGGHVVYSSQRDGRWRIYQRLATAVGPEELLLEHDTPVQPLQSLSSTGLLYSGRRDNTPFDVWKLGDEGSTPLAQTGGYLPCDSRLSPDEQWLVYGRPETTGGTWNQTIYVSGPPFGEVRRVIADAASYPRWRADGRELFYLSRDSAVVATPIDPRRTPSDAPGATLFRASGLAPTGVSGQVYDVAPDGSRFLLKREVGPSSIRVVVNWDQRLTR